MSQYSLINAQSVKNGRVTGTWIQDHYGDDESAKKVARDTEEVNGNQIRVVISEPVGGTTPLLHGTFHDLKIKVAV